jgi:hypothetical protein
MVDLKRVVGPDNKKTPDDIGQPALKNIERNLA